jgi:hypothetical protein
MRPSWSFVPLMAQLEYCWATGTTLPRCAISAFGGRSSHILASNPICQKTFRPNIGASSQPTSRDYARKLTFHHQQRWVTHAVRD